MRHRHNNIRLVLDFIDYADVGNNGSYIMFFFKVFDTVEHNCVFQALEKFGFGSYFCAVVNKTRM